MIRTQVYIPQALYQQAKHFARLNQMTISQLLRMGLEKALEQKKTLKKDRFANYFIGKGKGKKGVEAAINHDDIYDHVSS